MQLIEIEVRSFLTKSQFLILKRFFDKEASKLGSWKESTVYYKAKEGDLRLRQTDRKSYLIYKVGHIHQEQREEIELELPMDYFGNLEKILVALGHKVRMRWFRKRIVYQWKGIKVYLDDTVGNGLMIEFERCSRPMQKQRVYEDLKKEFNKLLKGFDIKPTAKKELDQRFDYYKKHWKELIKDTRWINRYI